MTIPKEFKVIKGRDCLGSWTEYESALALFKSLKEGLAKGERLEIEEVKEDYVETVISAVGDWPLDSLVNRAIL